MSSLLSSPPEIAKESSHPSEESKEFLAKHDERAAKTSNNGRANYLDTPPNNHSRTSVDCFSEVSPFSLNYQDDNDRNAGQSSAHNQTRPHSRPPVRKRKWRQRLNDGWARDKGLILVILGQFFGALMAVTTRLLETDGTHGPGMDPFQILFARMSITILFCLIYLYWAKIPDAPFGNREVWSLLVARGVGGFFGASLRYLPIAEATVITFLAPSVACAACWVLIKEPFTRSQQIAALVSLFGIVLIARPTFLFLGPAKDHEPVAAGHADGVSATNSTSTGFSSKPDEVDPSQHLAAVGLGLVGVCGAACAYTTIRWIGKRAHPLISVSYFSAWCTIVSIVAVLAIPEIDFRLPSNLEEWGYLIFLGVCGFLMQFLLTAGLAHEKSSRATNMVYTQMIFALAFDKLIFDTTPDGWSIVGSSFVLGSALYVAVHKEKPREKTTSHGVGEEEVGLMAGNAGEERNGSTEAMRGVEEVQLRTIRV